MKKARSQLIGAYPIKKYKCGLVAGQKVRLLKDLIIRDTDGQKTGKIYRAGEIWEVISGAAEPPLDVWLLRPDRGRHTWSDDASIFDHFEVVD